MHIKTRRLPPLIILLSCTQILTGCGNGAAGEPGEVIHADSGNLISRSPIAIGSEQCPSGGMTIHYGVDKNASGALENDEINGSDVICNGENGLQTLISTAAVPVGEANCSNGGFRISTGLDSNKNSLLDSNEITNPPSVVCHGVGADGVAISETKLESLLSDTTVKISVVGSLTEAGKKTVSMGHGTGFFISDTGLILTNNHVVTGASQINIYDSKNALLGPAAIVGVAECADLAVIKLQNLTLKPKFLAWSDIPITRGLDTVAAGFPSDVFDKFGDAQFTYTKGSITSLPLAQGTPWGYVTVFSHDSQIYSGNSGGPLVDMNTGNVLGVNAMVTRYSDSEFGIPRFYAIAAEIAKPYSERLSKGENIHSIGITGETYFDSLYGLPKGIYIKATKATGHAAKIGILPGDVIASLNNVDLFVKDDIQWNSNDNRTKYSMERYCGILASYPPNSASSTEDRGAELPVKVLRSQGYGQVCVGSINGTALSCDTKDTEPNNTYGEAQSISIGQTVSGVIKQPENRANEWDGFTFTVVTAGSYRVRASSGLLADIDVYLDQTPASATPIASSTTLGFSDEDFAVTLQPGTYYVWITPYSVSSAAEYTLRVSQ